MRDPEKPSRGMELLTWAVQAWHYMRSITVRAGPGIQVHRSPSGTIISIPKARRQPTKRFPFQVYDIVKDGADWKCKVWPGHVLNIDPKYGVTEPVKYWLPTELDTPPAEPTIFTINASKRIYVRVDTTPKDIITGTSVVVWEDDPDPPATDHHQPPPSAAANGESPPPPLDGVYYYLIADFAEDALAPSGLRIDKQYHLGGPIQHRPALQEWYNIPETLSGATRYPIAKKWNATEARHELRSIAQINSADSGVPILEPLPAGPPTYPDSINFRNVRHRVTGDDATDATQQIEVKESADKKDIVVLGNGKVGSFVIQDYEFNEMGRIEWDDGLVTTEGDVLIILPPPGEINNS